MEESRLDNVNLRMKLAFEKLEVARDLIEAGHLNDAVNRAYYAMFYASKALLLAAGEDPHKHTGVVALFGARFVKAGLIDPRYGRALAIAKRLREECDYNERKRATPEEAQVVLEDAQAFVQQIERTLPLVLKSDERTP